MIREATGVEPVAPVLGCHLEARGGLVIAVRAVQLARPRERAEATIALDQAVPRPCRSAFEAQPQIADQSQCASAPGRIKRLWVAVDLAPDAGCPAVVEHRLADQLDLDRPVEALDR